MSRWRVRKDARFPLSWVAVSTGDLSQFERFSTHAYALTYADREARTGEVTLPRRSGKRDHERSNR